MTDPMTSTHPSGSFLIVGLRREFVKGISGAFSSLAHFARLLQTKTMSFSHQLISVSMVSKVPLPMSRLHASRSADSLSFSLLNWKRALAVLLGSTEHLCSYPQ